MAIRPLGSILRSIQTLFDAGSTGGMTEGQLLERFLSRRGEDAEAAFAALLILHGPMVWSVCRGILPDPQAAEDAFQATFLILVRKAGSIHRRDTIGPWLYGVARRVAVRAKAAEGRRRLREERGMGMQATPGPDPIPREQLEALHEEVDRLPEKYRDPVVLCHLEGRTHAEAARLLGCPVGTVSIRISRARERLRVRLTRRGWTLPATLAGVTLVPKGAAAAMPAGLAEATIGAARCLAAGKVVALGMIPASVTQLAEGAIWTMSFARLTMTVGVLTAGLVTAGVGLLANREGTAQVGPGVPRIAAAPQPAPADGDDRAARARSMDNLKRMGIAMQNFALANDGRLPPAAIRKDGKPLLSWRVALLPFLDSSDEALYRKFRLDEPWDSPHNKALLAELPDAYAPVVRKDRAGHATYYQVLVGPGALFEGDEGTKLSDIKDSTGLTLMVVEADRPVPWTKPEDVPYDQGQPPPKLGGQFEDGSHVVFADGGALFLSKEVAPTTLRALITRSGGEVIGADDLHPDRKESLHRLMEEINGRSLAVRKAIRTPVAYKKAQARKEVISAAEALISLSKEARGMSEEGVKDVKDVADPGRRWIELSDDLIRQLEVFTDTVGRADTTQAAARSAWNLVNQKCVSCHTIFRVEEEN